jgi:serine/threonine-protein kinase
MGSSPPLPRLLETVEAELHRLDLDAETIEQRPDETIRPPSREGEELGVTQDFASVLELGDTIGEGGMGIVIAAEEEALGRTVAVKTLRPESRDPRSVRKLLQEAWVTGRLEHPNVVPVYRVEVGEDKAPMVVLKRIEGDDWSSLMHEPAAISERFGAEDPLEWNLRVLLSVCNALRFAHDRGVIHRDIKPDNVMIGRYGEVYLVDWGLAVAIDESAEKRLPSAAEVPRLAGTPSYMSPEQLDEAAGELSVKTDVYLLGATLHEIITGEAPHQGSGLMDFVMSIAASKPSYPASAPPALVEIAKRAMQRSQSERQPDVETFEREILAFLERREALELVSQASKLLEELSSLLETRPSVAEGAGDRVPIYRLFGECRFGFQQALALWPECEPARDGLKKATETMAELELSRDEPRAAAALLSELDVVPPELSSRIEAALADKKRRDERLHALSEFMDPRSGGRTRRWVLAAIATVWVIMPAGLKAYRTAMGIALDHEGAFVGSLLLVGLVAAIVIPGRRVLFRTAVNRFLTTGAIVAVLAQTLMHVGPLISGWPLSHPLRVQYLPWFALGGVMTVAVDRYFAIPTVAFAIAYVLASTWPDYTFAFTTGCNVVLAIVLWVRWIPHIDDAED